jgi:hypothetical protein
VNEVHNRPQLVYREGETDETTIDGSFERTARALVLKKKPEKENASLCSPNEEFRGPKNEDPMHETLAWACSAASEPRP